MLKPSERPLCINCRWHVLEKVKTTYDPAGDPVDVHICGAQVSLVTGQPGFYKSTCDEERQGFHARCGLDGINFEPKISE